MHSRMRGATFGHVVEKAAQRLFLLVERMCPECPECPVGFDEPEEIVEAPDRTTRHRQLSMQRISFEVEEDVTRVRLGERT